VTDADDERAAQAGGDNQLRMLAKQDDQPVGAAELRQRVLHRSQQQGVRLIGRKLARAGTHLGQAADDQVRDDFGVGRTGELVTFAEQLFLEGQVVFDDAVVGEGQFVSQVPGPMSKVLALYVGPWTLDFGLWTCLTTKVRVSVGFGRSAVGRPAGVPDAGRAGQRRGRHPLRQRVDPANGLGDVKLAVGRQRGDARAVVAAVFEPPQPLEQKVVRLAMTDVTDNAAHACASGVEPIDTAPPTLLNYCRSFRLLGATWTCRGTSSAIHGPHRT
jgi:hypothetical protein